MKLPPDVNALDLMKELMIFIEKEWEKYPNLVKVLKLQFQKVGK